MNHHNNNFIKNLILILIVIIVHFDTCHATTTHVQSSPQILAHHHHQYHYNDKTTKQTVNIHATDNGKNKKLLRYLLPATLSFLAGVVSSAGGIGGGGLFIPILTITAGLDLKTASTFSAFMVTGGSIANVACYMLVKRHSGTTTTTAIDYDIALLTEPCMLLGVSCGVVLNVIFPEWLITLIFVVFIAYCTFKTCKGGVVCWRTESERQVCESTKVPLLGTESGGGVAEDREEGRMGINVVPWVKLGMLVMIWLAFFVLYLLRGNRYGQGIINIKACGTAYWIISSLQIPLAIIFTVLILCRRAKPPKNTQQEINGGEIIINTTDTQSSEYKLNKLMFPVMALLAGILGGVFGIGGGMFISPLLLQIGIEPEVAAGTCSFMVLFSSSMSAIQYLLLGMSDIYGPLVYAGICFIASLLGLTLVQRAIIKHGRASIIVFSVGTVMAFSTVLMTSDGALDVWRDYTSGKSMGFKKPC